LSKKDFHPRHGAYDLICFRTDRESTLFRKTRDLMQLSKKRIIDLRQSKKRMVVGDISLLNDFRDFVNLIEGSRKVFSDRLHVAILATILGKDTILYPNSYYKNKGVYEFSLSKYPNLKFVEDCKHFEIISKKAYSSINNFGLPVDLTKSSKESGIKEREVIFG
jgi:exopolysaccharide biosynthesis predicted pyruvyltransferase EpsI